MTHGSDAITATGTGATRRQATGTVEPRAMTTPSGRGAIGATRTCTSEGTASAAARAMSKREGDGRGGTANSTPRAAAARILLEEEPDRAPEGWQAPGAGPACRPCTAST